MSVDPIRRLKSMGHDVSSIPLNKFPTNLRKVCFICVNTYNSYRQNLGTFPITDSVAFAKCMKSFEFDVYILQSPHVKNFLPYMDKFLETVQEQLVFFYAGQPLVDPNESDNIQEMHFLFDDGSVNETQLADHIINHKNPSSYLYMITERCHKGSVFDIGPGISCGKQLPPKCISFSCIPDPTSSAQTNTFATERGVFVFQFTKILRDVTDCTPEQLEIFLKKFFTQYGHIFAVGLSSPELKTEPMFYIE